MSVLGEMNLGDSPMRPRRQQADEHSTMWAHCGWCGSAYRSATRRAAPQVGICWGCLRDEFPDLVKADEGGDRANDGEPRAA